MKKLGEATVEDEFVTREDYTEIEEAMHGLVDVVDQLITANNNLQLRVTTLNQFIRAHSRSLH